VTTLLEHGDCFDLQHKPLVDKAREDDRAGRIPVREMFATNLPVNRIGTEVVRKALSFTMSENEAPDLSRTSLML
jgi:hypothetical protein